MASLKFDITGDNTNVIKKLEQIQREANKTKALMDKAFESFSSSAKTDLMSK